MLGRGFVSTTPDKRGNGRRQPTVLGCRENGIQRGIHGIWIDIFIAQALDQTSELRREVLACDATSQRLLAAGGGCTMMFPVASHTAVLAELSSEGKQLIRPHLVCPSAVDNGLLLDCQADEGLTARGTSCKRAVKWGRMTRAKSEP